MSKNGNEFTMTSDQLVNEMHSDEAKVRQSLVNLLGNAAKFTDHGRVNLNIRKETGGEGTRVVFEVADSGIGMDDEQMKRLFEIVLPLRSSISRRYGGTGLGLSLTKQFCEMLGGKLSVRSAPNRGTTFTMKVPVRWKEPTVAPPL